MRIDSSGNVGIGTSSPDTSLQIGDISATNATGQGRIKLEDSSTAMSSAGGLEFTTSAFGSGYGWKVNSIDSGGGVHLVFGTRQNSTTWSESVRIDSSGNVGIGTDNPVAKLHIENGDIRIEKDTKATIGFRGHTTGSTALAFRDSNTAVDRMTIDASGNLLVGTTNTTWNSAEGLRYFNGDALIVTRTSDAPLFLNRLSTDGEILNFNKDGSTVGSIGTTGGDMYVGTGDTGIRFDDATNHIRPCGVSGANLDATIDIGDSTRRFKDLYLSGTSFIGKNTAAAFNTTVGVAIDGTNGYITAARSGAQAAYLNRTTSDGDVVSFLREGVSVGSVSVTTSATAYNTSSDARLKDVTGEARGLEVINELNPVAYNWKADGKADEG